MLNQPFDSAEKILLVPPTWHIHVGPIVCISVACCVETFLLFAPRQTRNSFWRHLAAVGIHFCFLQVRGQNHMDKGLISDHGKLHAVVHGLRYSI